jgi:hypothetical protein
MKRLIYGLVSVAFGLTIARGAIANNPAASMHWERLTPYFGGAQTLSGIQFGGDKFVAWGEDTLVYTQDGQNWHQGSHYASASGFKAIGYGNGRFVAVAESGHISVSTDGIHWNTQLVSTNAFADITFGAGMFVAVGANGLIATSSDGATWTQQTGTTKNLFLIAYGNGRFVAAARGDDARTPDGFVVSTNGSQWTEIAPTPLYTETACQTAGCKTATLLGGLVFFQGKFVLLALTVEPVGSFNSLLRSDDGITWTTGEITTAPVVGINSLVEVNGILTPPNVAFANGLWVKVDLYLWHGADPYQMTQMPISTNHITAVAAHGNVIVGVGQFDHLPHSPDLPAPKIDILVSTNGGANFDKITPPAGASGLGAIRYADGKFVAVGALGTIITSSNGLDWTKIPSNTTQELHEILHADGKWWAVGAGGQLLISSDNAATITARTINPSYELVSIAHGNGNFVAVPRGLELIISTNGTNWTMVGTNNFGGHRAVTYGDGKFVTVGFANATSTNAIDWDFNLIGGGTGIRATYWNGLFVTPKLSERIVEVSADGKHWHLITVDPKTTIYNVNESDGRLWAGGRAGSIWQAIPNPQLTPSLNANGDFQLHVTVAEPGNYRLLTSPSGLPGTWTPTTLLTISTQGNWTNPASTGDAQFYQVRLEPK